MLDRDPIKGNRKKVLLLGISYPCVASQMKEHGFPADVLTYQKPSVEQAVECVRRGILTEMDARDLARCVATEQATHTDVYSASKEIGAIYRSDRHVYADFNARNFCQKLRKQFGEDIQFSQVILDYYWMPTGWLVTRWAKTLFQQTLPELVENQMLTFPSKRKGRKGKEFMEEGVVYLPFCAHVCKELVGGIDKLEKYYAISFVHKKDLHGHSLWKGTMEIDAKVMQTRLGKRLDQEEVYCTFRPKDIFESMEDSHVSKPAVLRILLAIKDYNDIRMVKLRPLRQHERASVFRQRYNDLEKGGFMGLDFELSARLQKEMKRGKKKAKKQVEEEKKNDDPETTTTPKANKRNKAVKNIKPSGHSTVEMGDVELPIQDRFMFYTGPSRDLDTYNRPLEMASEDQKASKAAIAEAKKSARSARGTKGKQASPRKGLVKLAGDHEVVKKASVTFSLPKEYMSFNPRQRSHRKGASSRRRTRENAPPENSFELDWSMVEPTEEEVKRKALELPPADEILETASVLFFNVKKEFNTKTQMHQAKQISRLRGDMLPGKFQWDETVCFSVDQGDCQRLIPYKLQSRESLQESIQKFDVPLSSVLESCRGNWQQLLDREDRQWVAKFQKGLRSRQKRTGVGANLNGRLRNLNRIIRWLLFGRQTSDDPSGCFPLIESKLGQTYEKHGRIATEIEKILNAALVGSANVGIQSDSAFREAIDRYQNPPTPLEELLTVCERKYEDLQNVETGSSDLLEKVNEWLKCKLWETDPTGVIRLIDEQLVTTTNETVDERAREIALRIEFLRDTGLLDQAPQLQPGGSDEVKLPRRPRSSSEVDFHDFLTQLQSTDIETRHGANVAQNSKQTETPEGNFTSKSLSELESPVEPRRLVSPSSIDDVDTGFPTNDFDAPELDNASTLVDQKKASNKRRTRTSNHAQERRTGVRRGVAREDKQPTTTPAARKVGHRARERLMDASESLQALTKPGVMTPSSQSQKKRQPKRKRSLPSLSLAATPKSRKKGRRTESLVNVGLPPGCDSLSSQNGTPIDKVNTGPLSPKSADISRPSARTPSKTRRMDILGSIYGSAQERKKRNEQQTKIDILARIATPQQVYQFLDLETQDLLVEKTARNSCITVECYHEWILEYKRTYGRDRARNVHELCLWLASNGQYTNSFSTVDLELYERLRVCVEPQYKATFIGEATRIEMFNDYLGQREATRASLDQNTLMIQEVLRQALEASGTNSSILAPATKLMEILGQTDMGVPVTPREPNAQVGLARSIGVAAQYDLLNAGSPLSHRTLPFNDF